MNDLRNAANRTVSLLFVVGLSAAILGIVMLTTGWSDATALNRSLALALGMAIGIGGWFAGSVALREPMPPVTEAGVEALAKELHDAAVEGGFGSRELRWEDLPVAITSQYITLARRAAAIGGRTGAEPSRHATIQPGRILITVEMKDPPPHTDAGAPTGSALLAEADAAIEIEPERRRGRVSKYRYGPTNAIAVDVITVKVPS